MTANDVLPLFANFVPHECVRLVLLLTKQREVNDAARYASKPLRTEELSVDEDSLGWEVQG